MKKTGNPFLCIYGHRWLGYKSDSQGHLLVKKCVNCKIETAAS